MSAKRGQTFGPTQRLEKQYAAAIGKITKKILAPVKPEQSLDEWLAEIAERSQAADVQEASDLLSRQMVQWANVKNARTWREAAAKSQRSRELHRLLQKEMEGPVGIQVQRLIQDNAGYISSVPLDAARVLVGEVTKAQQAGARAGTISKMMKQRFPELLRSRVHLISRTEVSKASLALTEARCQELDLPAYIWRTSKDQRVRDSHRLMDGVLVFWNDPPSPEALDGIKSTLGHYHAGGAPNDRCTQEVLLSIDDIGWPHRVYSNGSIHTMNKTDFKQRFSTKGIESAA
jgi:SPP1 gp7 family putative phage head morphogenesis protein